MAAAILLGAATKIFLKQVPYSFFPERFVIVQVVQLYSSVT